MQLDFAEVLLEVLDRRASDLHITAGTPPMLRVRGRLAPLEGFPVLTPTDTREIVYSILSDGQRQRFENNWQLDFAYQIPGKARFRVNAYFQRTAIGAAFRLIPAVITPIDELGLPPFDIIVARQGLERQQAWLFDGDAAAVLGPLAAAYPAPAGAPASGRIAP